MKYFLSIAVAISLFSTSLSATFTFVYSPSQLVSNVNQPLYLWEDPVGAVGSPLLSDADFSSNLNSSSFSFTISGLSYGSGTFNELETKIINDEVVFSFSHNGEEYNPLDKSSFFVISWGTENATYNLDANGFSLTFVESSIFEMHSGEYDFFHTLNTVPEEEGMYNVMIQNGSSDGSSYYVPDSETSTPVEFTLFYAAVPEASSYALLFGSLALGLMVLRRR